MRVLSVVDGVLTSVSFANNAAAFNGIRPRSIHTPSLILWRNTKDSHVHSMTFVKDMDLLFMWRLLEAGKCGGRFGQQAWHG